eukprot:2303860-Pleurochrysis_carterae.AAC.1
MSASCGRASELLGVLEPAVGVVLLTRRAIRETSAPRPPEQRSRSVLECKRLGGLSLKVSFGCTPATARY